jgi:hypothetical protein
MRNVFPRQEFSPQSADTVGAAPIDIRATETQVRDGIAGEGDAHGDGKVIGVQPENFNAHVTAMQTGRTG